MATSLTNNPGPFVSLVKGATDWDAPLDTWVAAVSADVATVRDVADGAATAAATAGTKADQALAAAAAGNTSASNLTSGSLAPERILDASLPLTKLATPVASKAETDGIKATADAALAATAAAPTPPREATASTTLLPSDTDKSVRMRNQAAAVVTVPLTSNTATFRDGALVGVTRFDNDVAIAPYAPNTSLQRVRTASGLKLRDVNSTATVEVVRRSAGARPTGFWAVLSAAQLDGAANGATVTTLSPDAASTVTLPAVTPTGTQRPTVVAKAVNGHAGLQFNGSSNTLPLSGAWLNLFSSRSNAMVLVTLLVPGVGITGNRTIVSFSVNGTTAPRVLMKWRDNGIAGPVVGGRRTDSTTEASAFVSSVGLNQPDLSVLGARYVWSTSDAYVLRNNTQLAANTAYQTDGTTPATASTTAAIGSSSTGDSEFFQGILLEVAIGPDDATLRASYQAWAELFWGEEALINGDTVA